MSIIPVNLLINDLTTVSKVCVYTSVFVVNWDPPQRQDQAPWVSCGLANVMCYSPDPLLAVIHNPLLQEVYDPVGTLERNSITHGNTVVLRPGGREQEKSSEEKGKTTTPTGLTLTSTVAVSAATLKCYRTVGRTVLASTACSSVEE